MSHWQFCRDPRPPVFQLAVGIFVSSEQITLLLLFWRPTWRLVSEPMRPGEFERLLCEHAAGRLERMKQAGEEDFDKEYGP